MKRNSIAKLNVTIDMGDHERDDLNETKLKEIKNQLPGCTY